MTGTAVPSSPVVIVHPGPIVGKRRPAIVLRPPVIRVGPMYRDRRRRR